LLKRGQNLLLAMVLSNKLYFPIMNLAARKRTLRWLITSSCYGVGYWSGVVNGNVDIGQRGGGVGTPVTAGRVVVLVRKKRNYVEGLKTGHDKRELGGKKRIVHTTKSKTNSKNSRGE